MRTRPQLLNAFIANPWERRLQIPLSTPRRPGDAEAAVPRGRHAGRRDAEVRFGVFTQAGRRQKF